MPLGRPAPARERLLDLGSQAVVLDGKQRLARERRVREDAPIQRHDGHASAHLACRGIDHRVEFGGTHAPCQRLLDHAGHQTGFGEETLPLVLGGSLAQAGTDQQEHREERRGRGRERRDRHARAQSEHGR